MPEHKHTPAPWSDGKLVLIAGQDKVGLNLGFVMTGRDERYQESLANARMIVAAPDLLEALQYAIQQVPELETVPGIAAAIAKATGQA